MTDLIHRRNPRDRLESALARVVAAMTRLQRQRQQAQARYEMLDRTGSEILATIDALLKEPARSKSGFEQIEAREVTPVRHIHSATADAA